MGRQGQLLSKPPPSGQQSVPRPKQKTPTATTARRPLDVVEGDSEVLVVVLVVAHGHVDCRFVDTGILGQLAVLLQIPSLVSRVLVDDVDLLILEVSLGHQHNVTGCDPYLFPHLTPDVAKTGHTVKAETLASAIPEHLDHLRVLLACVCEKKVWDAIVTFDDVIGEAVLVVRSFVVRRSSTAQKGMGPNRVAMEEDGSECECRKKRKRGQIAVQRG